MWARSLPRPRSTFQQNSATFRGGALVVDAGSRAALVGCTFTGNSVLDAGALGGAIATSKSALNISGCTFSANSLAGNNSRGGAVFLDVSVAFVTDTVFAANAADQYGGAMAVQGSPLDVRGCVFRRNTVGNSGGAVYLQGSKVQARVTLCTAWLRLAPHTNAGRTSPAAPTASGRPAYRLAGLTFCADPCHACMARVPSAQGGGSGCEPTAFIPGTSVCFSSKAYFTGSTFFANSAVVGGGAVQADVTPVTIANSIFTANAATLGGAVVLRDAEVAALGAGSAAAGRRLQATGVQSFYSAVSWAVGGRCWLDRHGGGQGCLAEPGLGSFCVRCGVLSWCGAPGPQIGDSVFTQNQCARVGTGTNLVGGAVYAVGLSSSGVRWQLAVLQSTFVSNACPGGSGGAMYAAQLSYLYMSDNTFRCGGGREHTRPPHQRRTLQLRSAAVAAL